MHRPIQDGAPGKGLMAPNARVALPDGEAGYRVVDIDGASFEEFSARVIELVSGAFRERSAFIPEVALREIVDNLVHAVPCSASVVVDHSCQNIYISDTGPGIPRPDLAFEPGYSTATISQRSYIRGVGIGLSMAREDIRSHGGELHLDTDVGGGTYVRICLVGVDLASRATGGMGAGEGLCLSQRQNNILFLLSEGESLGPSGVSAELNIGVSTAHRDLVKLEELGLISVLSNGRRCLSDMGRSYLQSLLSL